MFMSEKMNAENLPLITIGKIKSESKSLDQRIWFWEMKFHTDNLPMLNRGVDCARNMENFLFFSKESLDTTKLCFGIPI
jgi:hypothetical protein